MAANTRFRIGIVLLLGSLLLLGPRLALAQNLPRIQGQINDLTTNQVLASQRSQIESALSDLQQRENIQLFVLFVETTGGTSVTQFASQVAQASSLGGNDALLVVALSDRTDALWRGSQSLSRLTDRELEDVLSLRVEPRLAQGDFGGAVVGAAQGLREVAGTGETQLRGSGGSGNQPGLNLGPLIIVVLVALLGIWAWRTYVSRRETRKSAQAQAQQLEQLAQETNTRLIATDEALRAAQQEVAFAEAQFSEADVAPYREAIAQASAELKAAFQFRQQLDDDVPEDDATRRRLLTEMTERTQRAQALLDEQRQRIEKLRDIERHAPQILAAMPAQIDALEARMPDAEQTLATVQRYAEASWASVHGNLAEAAKRLVAARESQEAGQQAVTAGDSSAAGQHARTAQQALTEATQLIDAIDALAKSLKQAQQALEPQLATAQHDLGAARAAIAGSSPSTHTARLKEGERLLQQAQAEAAMAPPDVLAAYRLATQAEAVADEILANVQEEEAQRVRERQMLAAQLQVAEASYTQASDYIAARHGGIGREARTRLAEAERQLARAQALADTDPRAALAEAKGAERRAREAYALARDDFDSYDRHGGTFGGGGGIVLPIPIPMGGGWGGAGWGGSPWGSFGGGGGGAVGGGWSGGSGGGGAVGGHW
jgi:uncharacterized membrane protein YgcG